MELGELNDHLKAEDLSSTTCTQVYGGSGTDYLTGGDGSDFICTASATGNAPIAFHVGCNLTASEPTRSAAQDVVFAGGGSDVVAGDSSINSLHGGPGDDTLYGMSGDDLLIGDEGDDRLEGGPGSDMLDTNWFEGRPGQQERAWTKGNDTIYGDAGEDIAGYNHHTTPVRAGPAVATASNGTDTFDAVETLMLSKADDIFSRGPGSNLTVQGLAGNDQIDVSGDPSTDHNQRVECGAGQDSATVDVSVDPNLPAPAGSGGGSIRDDGQGDCEAVSYRVA